MEDPSGTREAPGGEEAPDDVPQGSSDQAGATAPAEAEADDLLPEAPPAAQPDESA
jgi:hypothetical protein